VVVVVVVVVVVEQEEDHPAASISRARTARDWVTSATFAGSATTRGSHFLTASSTILLVRPAQYGRSLFELAMHGL
jgi:hypothetical protein